MARVVFTLLTLALLATSCRGDGEPSASMPTATPGIRTSPTALATPVRFPTVAATPVTEPATLAGCPIDDEQLCGLALELEGALNSGNVGYFVARLYATQRPCRDVFYALDDDVGCPTEEGTSPPLVYLLHYGSDCCSTRPENFASQFDLWLNASAGRGSWRVYGIETGGTFWRAPGLLLVRGRGEDAPIVNVGTVAAGDLRIPGVIVGQLQTVFIFPGAELLLWP